MNFHNNYKFNLKIGVATLSMTACNFLQAQSLFAEDYENESSPVHTNLEFSKYLLSWQRGVTDHTPYIIQSYQKTLLKTGKFYLSGHASYSFYGEQTNTDGKFPILGRFPEQHAMTGKKSSTYEILYKLHTRN